MSYRPDSHSIRIVSNQNTIIRSSAVLENLHWVGITADSQGDRW